jgi:aldehyde:ferredoxin oxidoreductase
VAGYDSLGACTFASFGFSLDPDVIPTLIRARYGWDVGEDYLADLGRESLWYEREFNRLAGFTSADDRLPEWMSREPLPPHNTIFDVPDEELDAIFADLDSPE